MSVRDLPRDRFDGAGDITRSHGVAPDLQQIVRDELGCRTAKYPKVAADAAASTVTAETAFHEVEDPNPQTGTSDAPTQIAEGCIYRPSAALTANDTTYATLRVRKRNKAGTDMGVVFEVTTQTTGGGGSGNWTAFVGVNVPKKAGTAASVYTMVDGDTLTFEILKASTGVVVTAGVLSVYYR